ncbi:DUF1579 domain-containing protein [Ktedonosporobacter rubrisoli]|uniref:DUF1579 domain-containing protein n=1 Tax=Ktedonosporobacter rubrisoli TaxID=2509675 RepID=A0A4P6JP02_KTERU|nr:DUF1579 family protein [Ktedonosporobacter rubrisoli]QBD76975.1 DUF1579 domain-containing protein [Ktedonosporobacter rubrisoli]
MYFIKRAQRHVLCIAFLFVLSLTFAACGEPVGIDASVSPALNSAIAQTSPSQGSGQPSASLRLAKPGPPLTRLQPLMGTWQTELTIRQTPTSTPVVSNDITTRWQWVVDGCYVQEEMTGKLAGAPYYRLGYLTYNNLDERYEFVTMDHFDTGFMRYQSVALDSGNMITLYGHFTEGGSGPKLEGQVIKIRYVFSWQDENHMSESMYFTRPADKEYLAIRYVFTRQK